MSPKWPAGKVSSSFNFQFNGTLVVSPSGSIPPFGIKTSRPAEHKVMGTGAKNCGWGNSER